MLNESSVFFRHMSIECLNRVPGFKSPACIFEEELQRQEEHVTSYARNWAIKAKPLKLLLLLFYVHGQQLWS